MPLIPGLGRQGRKISEFEVSMDYSVSSRIAKTTKRKLLLKNQSTKKPNQIETNKKQQQKVRLGLQAHICNFSTQEIKSES